MSKPITFFVVDLGFDVVVYVVVVVIVVISLTVDAVVVVVDPILLKLYRIIKNRFQF